ncbi:phenylacetic acid degradation bifunctional protein PaaZ [Caulobacter soli]|uniref:phenylacetic acid degradation bifunctional protein PaaZ n=1 Tax=Caulobacter soli TaxID=2708539 RepID=UPI0013EB727D|nr:phenylacetic acid degradation bifunctional protein PaaZ [Caulobacter soli]
MKPLHLQNYAAGAWFSAQAGVVDVPSAVNGETAARLGSQGVDFAAMADHARKVGGPALRAMTFHERAKMIKALAEAIIARKEELYALSALTGATRTDGWVDIEGGASTLFAYASKGRRELPNDKILLDGALEPLSKRGSFVGQHILSPLQGVALHINAFNFPVWGMLEKLGPTLLAGVPAIVKPASATAYVTEQCVRIMLEAGVLPPGALQLIVGSTGDLFDHLTGQDVVSFTGSAATANKLRSHPTILRESVRFIAECDSLNATVLGPDCTPETPEFDLFAKEIVREMTVKAGQKCTAIRRVFVPAVLIDAVQDAVSQKLAAVVVGDPAQEGVTMGALVSQAQRADVRAKVADLVQDGRIVFGDPDAAPAGVDAAGAFMSPVLLRCDTPWTARHVHDTEAFGPVATLMPYKDLADAVALCRQGQGSLVMSLFTYDPAVAIEVIDGAAAFHGRVLVADRDCARESTGHGSPLPGLVHGGPGRAGGGEEMGGLRGLSHYMQRTALQGSPRMLAAIGHRYIAGSPQVTEGPHPFRLKFDELAIGKTFNSAARTISLADIEHFAEFTGDTFYAHMDEAAAAANPFFPGRVAHGYLILSFAAGLFVDPAPGPVLANYGLDNLRFVKPVSPGDAIAVRLTAMAKSRRNDEYGEVRWDAQVTNQDGDTVAAYELLTMNAI